MMGDFNDEPHNRAIHDVLDARAYSGTGAFDHRMVNTAAPVEEEGRIGSYFYKKDWELIDQIMVSPGVLDDKGWCCTKLPRRSSRPISFGTAAPTAMPARRSEPTKGSSSWAEPATTSRWCCGWGGSKWEQRDGASITLHPQLSILNSLSLSIYLSIAKKNKRSTAMPGVDFHPAPLLSSRQNANYGGCGVAAWILHIFQHPHSLSQLNFHDS
ncbi:MAG: endonuclease/exonuclease/phosphatase family protein [Chlorobi bacterium OLB7]|nr:MAG: endonuclease/exonuclease/phosphatase family protein [Chlorobi bacterium OLB7]